jgi:hypothetical protein
LGVKTKPHHAIHHNCTPDNQRYNRSAGIEEHQQPRAHHSCAVVRRHPAAEPLGVRRHGGDYRRDATPPVRDRHQGGRHGDALSHGLPRCHAGRTRAHGHRPHEATPDRHPRERAAIPGCRHRILGRGGLSTAAHQGTNAGGRIHRGGRQHQFAVYLGTANDCADAEERTATTHHGRCHLAPVYRSHAVDDARVWGGCRLERRGHHHGEREAVRESQVHDRERLECGGLLVRDAGTAGERRVGGALQGSHGRIASGRLHREVYLLALGREDEVQRGRGRAFPDGEHKESPVHAATPRLRLQQCARPGAAGGGDLRAARHPVPLHGVGYAAHQGDRPYRGTEARAAQVRLCAARRERRHARLGRHALRTDIRAYRHVRRPPHGDGVRTGGNRVPRAAHQRAASGDEVVPTVLGGHAEGWVRGERVLLW